MAPADRLLTPPTVEQISGLLDAAEAAHGSHRTRCEYGRQFCSITALPLTAARTLAADLAEIVRNPDNSVDDREAWRRAEDGDPVE